MSRPQRVLSAEDQDRVNRFLISGANTTAERVFKPLKLAVLLTVTIVILGVISRIIGALMID